MPAETLTDVQTPPEIEVRGAIDDVTPDGDIHGWCWSPDQPDARRTVTVVVDGEDVAHSVADLLREDLRAAGVGDGGHGLFVELPETARQATAPVLVAVRDTATGRPIGAERLVTWRSRFAPPVPLAGNIDTLSRDGWVAGWCWDPENPQRRLMLAIRVDGETVGSVVARDIRPDLERAAVGDGHYGFTFAFPYEVLADRGEVEVVVVEQGTDRPLGAPMRVQIGRLVAEQARIRELERQLTLLRGRIDELTRLSETRARADDQATRSLFGVVAAFFSDLADGASPAAGALGPHGGVEAALETVRGLGPPIVLRAPATDGAGRPRATIAVACDAPVEAVHACLLALHEAGADTLAEIVLLAPGQTDPRCALLPAHVAGLRVSAEMRVLTALSGVLQSADALVALVAADVRPDAGWLPALLQTLDLEPGAAAVGCLVVRPDGLGHHAGFLLRDGRHYVELAPQARLDAPEQRVMRPVDALGPLALLFEPRLVRAVGGLDAAYTDLAAGLADLFLRLRAAGHAVLRQPAARALWAGPGSRAAAHLPDRLPEASEDATRLSLALARIEDRVPASAFVGHALVVDDNLPDPNRDGGSTVTIEQMQVLRRLGWRVTFMAAAGAPHEPALRATLERCGIAVIDPDTATSVTAYLRAEGAGLDMVHIYRHRNAGLLLPRVRELAPRARTVFSPADLHFLRESRGALLTGRPADAQDVRAQELACVRAADATVLLSEHECDLLAADVDPAKLHLVRWITRPVADVPDFAARAGCVFVGHFRHPPNVDAALWCVREILPVLRARRPGIMLDLVGGDAPPPVEALAAGDVRVRGWVAELAPLLAATRLTVAPLRYGAGFKGKVATSLAHGVPVVGTSMAFEGSGLADGDGIAIADDPTAFAAAIARLHDDAAYWQALSQRARERVSALYSEAAATIEYRKMLIDLGLKLAG